MALIPRVLLIGGPDVDLRIQLMVKLRHEFDLAAAGTEPRLASRFAEAGFPYVTYPMPRGLSPLSDLRSMRALRRLLRECGPDIVHTFDTKPCVWGRLMARRVGVPIVAGTIPGLGFLYANDSLRTRAIRSAYRRLQGRACAVSDLTIFQNARDARQFIDEGIAPAERSVVIPGSGVETSRYDPAKVDLAAARELRQRVGAGTDEVVVTLVSRLIRAKGVVEFAEASKVLTKTGVRTRFLLVGPHDREARGMLSRKELEEVGRSVTWIGSVDDVRPVLAASDLFVLPTFYREGIPRVLLEAAAMGLPLVTTRTPGCMDVVENGVNGLLVEPRNTHALAEAIRILAGDPRRREAMGRASRRIARERFDLSLIAGAIAEQYRRLLADPGGYTRRFLTGRPAALRVGGAS